MPTVQQTANLRFWQPSSTILQFLHSFSFLWLTLYPLTFYASLFKHWSDILFREKYINSSLLCSIDTTVLTPNSINKVMSLQAIFWGQEGITLLTQAQWLLSCVCTAKNIRESCITCHWHCFHRLWQKLVGGEEGSHDRKRRDSPVI